MPGFDKKGPASAGSMTGRGKGLCGSNNIKSDPEPQQPVNLRPGFHLRNRRCRGQGVGQMRPIGCFGAVK